MGKKVCIDAGHCGKYNQSPVVPSYYESDFTFKLQGYLVLELAKYGIESIITRKTQAEDLSLGKRGSASKGCDLFMSLHTNACDTESVDSISVYCLVNDTDIKIDDVSHEIADKVGIAVHEVMSFTSGYRVLTKVSDKDKDGDGKKDDEYYGVLSAAKLVGVPAILVEHSFHTNTEATMWLLEDANVKSIAVAEAKAIAEYFGLSASVVTPVATIVVDNTSVVTEPVKETTPTSSSETIVGINLTAGLPTTSPTARYKVKNRIDGKQVGAYKILQNAIDEVKKSNGATGVYDAEQSNKLIYASNSLAEKTVTITASALRIRKDATASSACIGSIKEGINVVVTEEKTVLNNVWGKVSYDGKTGWISMFYTK